MTEDPRQMLLYLVAGEPSGDLLGARLMEALKRQMPSIRFAGIGGPLMAEQGLVSLFPYQDLSLIGIAEILPHIPRILKRLADAHNDIRAKKPKAVITIDCPGFTFRLAERLFNDATVRDIPRIHYVAPTVWAYKPKRALRAAKWFHHMLLLLPFEPPYFTKVGLANTYVGHAALWENKTPGQGAAFRARHRIAQEAPVICLLPGSRKWEVQRLLPIYEATLELMQKKHPGLQAVVVAGRQVKPLIEARVRARELPLIVVSEEEKKDAFAASNVALAKSGTVTLELAVAGVPMVVAYTVSSYSAWMMRRMIQIRYVTLVNIIEDREIIPEMLQEKCKPELLAAKLEELLQDSAAHREQLAATRHALEKLGVNQAQSPSDLAAQAVLKLIRP